MKEERRKKWQEIAKEIIARFIVEELSEESSQYGMITVTEIILSPDMSYLDAYVSSLRNSDTLTKYLAGYAKSIERKLCKSLSVVKLPRVRFRYDNEGKDSFEIYQKIKQLDV